eukprot:2521363-Amphidinium_carterae.1
MSLAPLDPRRAAGSAAVPEQAVTAESRKRQSDGNDDERTNEERAITEGGTDGALASWCGRSHRMFKEASAEECRME